MPAKWLPERAAWRLIARERATLPKQLAKTGLCYQVMDLYDRELIRWPVAKWMLSRIYHHMPFNKHTGRFAMHAYRRADSRYANRARILAALWFALEAHADAR